MKLSFDRKFRAIPTMGGVISEARTIDSSRFPDVGEIAKHLGDKA